MGLRTMVSWVRLYPRDALSRREMMSHQVLDSQKRKTERVYVRKWQRGEGERKIFVSQEKGDRGGRKKAFPEGGGGAKNLMWH